MKFAFLCSLLVFQLGAGFLNHFPGVRLANFANSKCKKAPFVVGKALFATTPEPEQFKFESNVARVMDIIINSLYSNKDVFIRELVSNAADACDKKRFLAITGNAPSDPLRIRVSADRDQNTLTIEDTGVGMNKEDLIQNLGRIAESGTKKFLDNASAGGKKDDLSLIGQFGVGFYSGFLVANKMDVVTKGSKGEQLKWEAASDKLDQYTISPDNSEPISTTGTRITLHLKDEADQYLDDITLRALLERYSEFTPFPIELQRNVTKPHSVPDTSLPVEEDGTVPMKTVMKKELEWTVVNDKKPLWLRSPKTCNDQDYHDFYKQTFKAYDAPMAHTHFSVEGNVDFKAMLFLPSEVPYELTRDMFATAARSMRLYVRRVFINDKFEDLIPRWLLFLRGVVDSDDLPLNVGREILQQSRSLRIIKQRLVKKSIDMFADLANRNATEYATFWKNFGKYIKVGIIEGEDVRDELVPLVRFHSSHSEDEMTSLSGYVSRMKEGQKSIYYVVGESREQAARVPALEGLRSKGFEIIYLTEPIDEMTMQNIEKFEGKPVSDAGKESNLDMSEDEKADQRQKNEDMEGFRMWMKSVLQERITKVEVSTRLVNSPATIVQSEYGVSPSMQKYLKAQAVADDERNSQFANVFNQAVLEINPSHTIIKSLCAMQQQNPDSAEARETVELIFNTAALAAGYVLDNAADYSQMVVKMMSKMAGESSQSSTSSKIDDDVGAVNAEAVSRTNVDTEVESGGDIDAEIVE